MPSPKTTRKCAAHPMQTTAARAKRGASDAGIFNAARSGRVNQCCCTAGKVGCHGLRDGTMLAVAYRHGLRVSEFCSLRWDQVDLDQALLHVRRCKNGCPSTHSLHEQE